MKSMVNFYASSNLKKTTTFYLDLGLTIYYQEESSIIFDSGYGYLGFIEKKPVIIPDYNCISFDCESLSAVDAVYDNLKSKYSCTVPKQHPKFKVYSFFLNDPDGYTVEFQYILV